MYLFQTKLTTFWRYTLAIIIFAIALFLRFLLLPVEAGYAFVTFYPTVVLGFYLCGIGPGALIVTFSAIAAYYIFIPPYWQFTIDVEGSIALAFFLFSASLIGFMVNRLQTYSNYVHDLFDKTASGMIAIDPNNGRILMVNLAAQKMWGYSTEEFLSKTIDEVTYPDDLAESKQRNQQLKMGLVDQLLFKKRYLRKDGSFFWAETNARILNGTNGKAKLYIGSVVDITERMADENSINELNRDFVTFLENTGDFVYFKDKNSRFLFCSQTLANITGYDNWRDLIGKHDLEVFPQQTAKAYYDEELPIFSEGVPLLNKIDPYIDASGHSGWVSTSKWPIKDEQGNVHGIFGISRDITAEKEAQDKVRESEQLYLGLLEDQTEIICRFTIDGTILFVNDAYCRFFGASKGDVIGHSWEPVVFPEDLSVIAANLKNLSLTNPIVTIENRVIAAGGEIRWLQFINRAIFNEQGELFEMQAVGRDITERKQSDAIIHELYNQITQIASRVPGVIYQYQLRPDGSSCFPFASDAIRDIYRVAPEAVREDASAVLAIIHPDDIDGVIASIKHSATTLNPWQYEYRVRFSDGTTRCLFGNAIPNREQDGSVLWNGFITDVTKHKQIELALQRESEKNRVLLRNASDGIHILDTEGNVIEASDSFCAMLGYFRDEVIGMNVSQWDAGLSDSERRRIIREQLERPIRSQFERRHRRKNGTEFDVEISGFPLELDGKQVLFNSSRDISDRKALEAQLTASATEIEDLYNHAPCGYHSLDINGVFQNINATELTWLGLTREEVVGKMNVREIFTADGQALFKKSYPKFLENKHIENLEFELVGKDRTVKNVSLNASAIFDGDGNFLKSRSVFFDITELKKTQTELSHLANEQTAMLDNELIGMVKLKGRRAVWINKAMHIIFGYKEGELNGKLSRVLYSDDYSYEKMGEDAYAALKKQGVYRTQLEMQRKSGEKIWLDVSGTRLPGHESLSLWMMVDITTLKKHELQIERIAYHDTLTGLPNRLLISDRLTQAVAQIERSGNMLAVCYLDLDGFKPVNDTWGHTAGDKVLVEIAQRMQSNVRVNDTVGRLGGDEFVLLLTNLDNVEEYHAVLQRVIEAINEPITLDNGHEVRVGASIGVTLFPSDRHDPDILLRHADNAMYQAKQSGRNRVCVFDASI